MTFDNRFELLRELGRGEFAKVFEVRDRDTGAALAMKCASAGQSLAAEFETTSRMQHDNVVRARELGHLAGASAFTLDLAPGEDIVTHVRHDVAPAAARGAHLPMAFGQPLQPIGSSIFLPCTREGIERLRRALVQLVDALTYVHRVGLVHRDLRPCNVRVNRTGHLTLIDFGLATKIGERGSALSLGAPSHFAPEDASGSAAHPASDWYALGVILFEALTGDLPFAGTGQDVLLRKQTVSAPSPSFFAAGIPPELDAICRGLLAPSTSLRFGETDVRARLT